jgi:hypothetical protein
VKASREYARLSIATLSRFATVSASGRQLQLAHERELLTSSAQIFRNGEIFRNQAALRLV